jgi:site-specific recombinase XerD
VFNIAGPHALTCLTCRTPRNADQQAFSQKQVQVTFATELANADVSVYTLMKLLGHESMTTSQRYVSGAGTENRSAAAQNPLYELIEAPTSND